MESELAKLVGQLALFFLLCASAYYILRSLLIYGPKTILQQYIATYRPALTKAVGLAREWHVRVALTATALALLHGTYMFTANELGAKALKGGAAAAALLTMLVLGTIIRSKPGNPGARVWHRRGMYTLGVLVLAHIL